MLTPALASVVPPFSAPLEAVDDPWYISLFFFTSGVARVVFFVSFWHLEQTMMGGGGVVNIGPEKLITSPP